MYLGKNEKYQLSVKVEPGGLCPLFFEGQSATVRFSKADIAGRPKAGKLSSAGRFNFAYAAPAKPGTDQFILTLCGTDMAGTGCNTLDYRVDIR